MRFYIPNISLLLFVLALLATGLQPVFAQQDPQFSQYMQLPGSFNPAVTGLSNDIQAAVINRQQWIGVDHAGNTLTATVGSPVSSKNNKHGIGLTLGKDQIGLFSTQIFQAQYAYRFPLLNGLLSLGIQGGILQKGFDASGIFIPTTDFHVPNETFMPNGTLEGMAPDMSAGVWFENSTLYMGLSATHMLESSIKMKVENSQTGNNDPVFVPNRTYYFTGGYNIVTSNPFYTLQPSLLVKSDLVSLQLDLSAKLLYKDLYWGGVGWRKGESMIVMAGLKMKQGLKIGYAYDIPNAQMATYSSGSHEIFLGYAFKRSTMSTGKKQKSVRIL